MTIKLNPVAIDTVMAFLREHITEERTDEWIDYLVEKLHLPRWIPSFIVRRVLDSMLPQKVLDSIESLLRKSVKDGVAG